MNIDELAAMARRMGMCAVIGPLPGPGMLPYLCTLPIDHDGAHTARDLRDRSTIYDSWM